MVSKKIKPFLITLLAALLVGLGLYGIARLLGSSVESAKTIALSAFIVGLLEKPILWAMRRSGIVRK